MYRVWIINDEYEFADMHVRRVVEKELSENIGSRKGWKVSTYPLLKYALQSFHFPNLIVCDISALSENVPLCSVHELGCLLTLCDAFSAANVILTSGLMNYTMEELRRELERENLTQRVKLCEGSIEGFTQLRKLVKGFVSEESV